MRSVLIVLVLAGSAWSQALTEVGAAIAGTSVGGVAGKKVSEGITNVFQKVEATAQKAVKTDKTPEVTVQKGAVLQVGSAGVVKDHSLVPPPPPPVRRAAVVPPPPPVASAASPSYVQPIPVLAPPPPPHATPEDLQTLASGTNRSEVLKLGAPASRITMYEDGHLVEIFRYQSRESTFGVVRLSDGAVSNVQLR
jgi:hypothetical protein